MSECIQSVTLTKCGQRFLPRPRYPLQSSSLEYHSGPRRSRLRWIALIGIRLKVMEPSPHWRRRPSWLTSTGWNTRSMYTNHLRHTTQTHTLLSILLRKQRDNSVTPIVRMAESSENQSSQGSVNRLKLLHDTRSLWKPDGYSRDL